MTLEAETTEWLRRSATATLLRNWRGTSTVPAARLYPHQWSWDSAFIAIGLSILSQRRAEMELQSLLGAQWEDGRVPHIVFNPAVPTDVYFPGPLFWRSDRHPGAPPVATSGLVQPPVHALAVLSVLVRAREPGRAVRFARRTYPALVAWHRYLERARSVAAVGGLAAIVHPWESGTDNSPLWDAALARVPADPARIARLRRDLDNAAAGERPTDEDYARYVRLAATYRDCGYDDERTLTDGEFVVIDPLLNTAWIMAEHALAEICRRIGLDAAPHEERAADLTAALEEHLFDAERGVLAASDVRTGARTQARTINGLVAVGLPGLSAATRAALLQTLEGPHFDGPQVTVGPPTYDLLAADFEASRYWRGPVWVNTGWLLIQGLRTREDQRPLANRIREQLLRAMVRAGFREYFDPLTGTGHGASDFSWSAALALDLLHSP